LKIVFDNARKHKAEEIYVTIFDTRPELQSLIFLLEKFGFELHGSKTTASGKEKVFVRDFSRVSKPCNAKNPALTFPWLCKSNSVFIVPIKPDYHTELFPDSKLNTESSDDFIENQPHRNSISKSYVSHSWNRKLKSGDTIVFYRSGGIYKGVATTIGIVEKTIDGLTTVDQLIEACRKRSVLKENDLLEYWDRNPKNRPFVINFLYAFSFPKRINLKTMLDEGILPSMEAIKTITKMEWSAFVQLLGLSNL
jgi:hypothetical protein